MSDHGDLNKKAAITRVVALVVLIGFCLLIYWLNPEPLRKIVYLLSTGDVAGSIEYIRSFGPYAAVVSFVIITCINILAVFPNIFMLAATGIIFGVVEGTIISWAAESFGVIISFALMRYFFHDYAHQLIVRSNALKKVDDFSGSNGFKIMVIARCIPFVPSGIISALGAVSSITVKDYILATLIGKIPSALIEVTLGHDLASYHEHFVRLAVLVVISFVSYWAFSKYKNKNKA
ncbi:MAG: ydjZ 1 [Firmicutes bacterium]|nr:ydjZ 1 [Bacillota bacterium]